MSVEKRFELSAKMVKNLKKEPKDDELLKLYGLYKQSTVGNCDTQQPCVFNLKDNSKWKAWNNCKNKTKEKSMTEYSDYVMTLIEKYGV